MSKALMITLPLATVALVSRADHGDHPRKLCPR